MDRIEAAPPRLGVDIGGTFTDIVLEWGGQRRTAKLLTTHAAPERGVLDGIGQIVAAAGLKPAEISVIVHGTTLATNALIERRGARTALITTAGFRDVVEIRTEDRYEQYDLSIDLPKPLVPRKWRFAVAERIDSRGNVLTPLDEAGLAELAERIAAEGIEAVAIGFLHSYRYPAHEQRAREILQARLPGLAITLSSEVSPEMREYERFSTACANAYIQPLMAGYLKRLETELARAGFACPVRLMLSGGGLTTIETSRRFPVRLVESGPAGGAIFSAHVARLCDLDRVLSFDMGGTTAKICLIDDCVPLMSRSFEVARVYRFKRGSGMPLRIPVIEMVEIGAGGGSIATVDRLGRIAVGPESAGSEPGPACYGRGGTMPAVTDADVVLGRIDPEAFAGGTVRLDPARSRDALRIHVGEPQGLDDEMCAFAISEVVEENMANAARVHAIESGTELAGRTLIAFGGAAPLHALRLAEKLGIDRVLIPSGAGVGSAVGFLRAPVSFEIVRSQHALLGELDLAGTDAGLAAMAAEARAVVAEAAPGVAMTERAQVFMRYAGQGHEIAVPLPAATLGPDGAELLRQAFEREYQRVYGRLVQASDIEILSWAVTVSVPAATAAEAPAEIVEGRPEPAGRRRLYDADRVAFTDAAVYHRDALRPGDRISGPAVIVERETSTLITQAFSARINGWGHIECERNAA